MSPCTEATAAALEKQERDTLAAARTKAARAFHSFILQLNLSRLPHCNCIKPPDASQKECLRSGTSHKKC